MDEHGLLDVPRSSLGLPMYDVKTVWTDVGGLLNYYVGGWEMEP